MSAQARVRDDRGASPGTFSLPVSAVILTAVILAGCATGARKTSSALASSGLSATSALSADVSDLATRFTAGDVENAFSRTWEVCQTRPDLCEARTVSPALSKARQSLATTIAAREQAITALNGAYSALKSEADDDAGANLAGAVRQALTAAEAYASIAGIQTEEAIGEDAVTVGAGLLAGQAQAKRLRQANLSLADAVAKLRVGLTKEQAAFDSLATDIVDQEVEGQSAFWQSGLTSSNDILNPLALSLGVTLVKDPDAVLAKSPAAKAAALAALKASAAERAAGVRNRYASALAILSSLERQHRAAAKGRPTRLVDIEQGFISLQGSLGAKPLGTSE